MKGFVDDIEARTEKNRDFRRVLYTGPHLQLVVMSPMKLYTIYAPPHHADGTVQRTKAEASTEHFSGKTTE